MSLRDPWASHPAGLQGLGTSVLTVAGPLGDVSVLQPEKLAHVKPSHPLLIRQCTRPTQQSPCGLVKPEVALFPRGNAWEQLSKTFGEGKMVLPRLVGKECRYISHKMSTEKMLENQRTQTLSL